MSDRDVATTAARALALLPALRAALEDGRDPYAMVAALGHVALEVTEAARLAGFDLTPFAELHAEQGRHLLDLAGRTNSGAPTVTH